MSDLIQRLRVIARLAPRDDDADTAAEAADEIERLRPAYATAVQRLASEIERLRLTDAEREAVEWCIFQQSTPQRTAVTLRGLLERLTANA